MSTLATIRTYQRLRKAGRVFHGKVLKVIPRPVIVSTATELGLWRKGMLVADEDERGFGCAMKTAAFSLFEILDTRPGSHVVLVDRLAAARSGEAGPPIVLVDLGLSETALPVALLAARLLNAGEFSMSTGVGFPFPAGAEAAILRYLREKEPGFRKKRVDMPEDYSLYFYRLHRQFGLGVTHGPEA